MSHIILCNTGSDSLSKIDTKSLKLESIYLSIGEAPFGPHGISVYKNKVMIANNYNNSISIIDLLKFNEEKNIYIGAHPNDLVVNDNTAYVLCGESRSVITYDLLEEKINFRIPVGSFPHSVEISPEKKLLFISNMGEDSISVIDLDVNEEITRIKVGESPVKIKISNNKKIVYVCSSYIGCDRLGYIDFISLNTLEIIRRIKVGLGPVDLFEDNNKLYVSNFIEGSISIIDLQNFTEEEKINVEGMPRGIIVSYKKIFVGDYLNGKLKIVNLDNRKIKVIDIGIEPNAMTLINND